MRLSRLVFALCVHDGVKDIGHGKWHGESEERGPWMRVVVSCFYLGRNGKADVIGVCRRRSQQHRHRQAQEAARRVRREMVVRRGVAFHLSGRGGIQRRCLAWCLLPSPVAADILASAKGSTESKKKDGFHLWGGDPV